MEKNKEQEKTPQKITRKQAIKKVGLTALATSSLYLLETKAQATSSGGRIAKNEIN